MDNSLLKSLVSYSPSTGEMHWRERTSEHISRPSSLRSWNTRYAGMLIGTVDGKGYIHFSYKGKFYRAHRMAWLYVHGELPNVIDHINGVKTDNRIDNLRDVSQHTNHLNQRINSKNTSGVMGVYLNKRSNIWCAQMKFKGITYHLGSSKSFFEAVCLRKSEEVRLGFHANHGRGLSKC